MNNLTQLLLLLSLLSLTQSFQLLTKNFASSNYTWPEENHHGYVQIRNSTDNQMFYWYFPSRTSPETDPLILWLTGGPGCSSELALFVENGPFKIDERTLELSKNPHSWNHRANLLYIDQPLGAGFSSVDTNN